jgi:flagellar biosynthesis regulator FlaF
MSPTELSSEFMGIPEEEAFGLSRAAVMLDQARQDRTNRMAMTEALNHNLELWVAIKTLVSREENGVPSNVRENLVKLGNFIADTTFKSADGDLTDETIDTLININLQISEGLLEGMEKN